MANSELSKLKILYIYEYFLKEINAFDDNSGVTIAELTGYLENELNYTFERKSIYSDISKINEYVGKRHKIKGGDAWIYLDGKKYKKSQLEDEITLDEARLIVDAINTTSFTDTSICDKIRETYPAYFGTVSRSRELYSRNGKIAQKSIGWLNTIRSAIDERHALKVTYGYKLGRDVVEKSDKIVSPLVLDWANNNYYLIAIDHNEVKDNTNEALRKAMRRYRLDKVSNCVYTDDKEKYKAFSSAGARKKMVDEFLGNSLSAYSSDTKIRLRIMLTGESLKKVLQAYNAIVDKIGPALRINDSQLSSGKLGLEFDVANVPTLYTALFEIVTFEGVSLRIDNTDVKEKFRDYIDKLAKQCS